MLCQDKNEYSKYQEVRANVNTAMEESITLCYKLWLKVFRLAFVTHKIPLHHPKPIPGYHPHPTTQAFHLTKNNNNYYCDSKKHYERIVKQNDGIYSLLFAPGDPDDRV